METEGSAIERIARDLGKVAERLVPGAFGVHEPGKKPLGPLFIPMLGPIVQNRFSKDWSEGCEVAALEKTLRWAIDRVEGRFGSQPPKGQRDTRITNQEAALRYLNLDGGPMFPTVKPVEFDDWQYEHVRGKRYNKVLYALVEASGISGHESTVTAAVKNLRLQLAKALAMGMIQSPDLEADEFDKTDFSRRTRYVRRRSIESHFWELENKGVPFICFIGPPAMGKTTLAEELTATRSGSTAANIRINTRSSEELDRSLRDALEILSVPTPDSPQAVERAFRDQVSEAQLRYVFIDNITDSTLLERLIPPQAKTTVVLAANQRLECISPEHCIEVERFTPDECAELFHTLLPGTTREEADQLGQAVGYHPMAITAACGMIANRSFSVDEFCSGLPGVASIVFDGLSDDGRQMLTAVYRQVLSTLSRTDPESALLLEMISILGDHEIDTTILAASLLELPAYRLMNSEHALAVTRRAIAHLGRYFLISQSYLPNGTVELHQLARAIVRGLLADQQKVQLAFAFLDGVVRRIAITRESGFGEGLPLYLQISYFYHPHVLSAQLASKGIARSSAQLDRENHHEAIARMLAAVGEDPSKFVSLIHTNPGCPPDTVLAPFIDQVKTGLGFSPDGSDAVRAEGPAGEYEARTGLRTYLFQGREYNMWTRSRYSKKDG